MMVDRPNRLCPPLALRKPEAARSLGMSEDSFERHVQPHLRVVRSGSIKLYPVAELERWIEANADMSPVERLGE